MTMQLIKGQAWHGHGVGGSPWQQWAGHQTWVDDYEVALTGGEKAGVARMVSPRL